MNMINNYPAPTLKAKPSYGFTLLTPLGPTDNVALVKAQTLTLSLPVSIEAAVIKVAKKMRVTQGSVLDVIFHDHLLTLSQIAVTRKGTVVGGAAALTPNPAGEDTTSKGASLRTHVAMRLRGHAAILGVPFSHLAADILRRALPAYLAMNGIPKAKFLVKAPVRAAKKASKAA
jgi:hypothetical protein